MQSLYCCSYGLVILDNQNLQEIWDLKTHPNLTIFNGNISFNQNQKLCLDKIQKFITHIGKRWDQVPETDISPVTNGDRVACKWLQVLTLCIL